jgi:hypothetical protein
MAVRLSDLRAGRPLPRSVLSRTQPPTQTVPGSLSPVVKRSGPKADHSPPTSAEVKDTPTYTILLELWWRSRYSDWLRAGQQRGRSSSPGRVKNFFFSTSSRPALGSTLPPNHWVPGALFSGVKLPGCEADHLQLMPRWRKCGSVQQLHHMLTWRRA